MLSGEDEVTMGVVKTTEKTQGVRKLQELSPQEKSIASHKKNRKTKANHDVGTCWKDRRKGTPTSKGGDLFQRTTLAD